MLFKKYSKKPFVRKRNRRDPGITGSRDRQVRNLQQTVDVPGTTDPNKKYAGRKGEFEFGIVLGQTNPRGSCSYSFLNVALTHFCAFSEVIFNVLTDTLIQVVNSTPKILLDVTL